MDAKSALQTAWQDFGSPLIQPFCHKPKWVYAFTVIVVALFAVDIVLIKGNAEPFFILPFYLLPLMLLATLMSTIGAPISVIMGLMMYTTYQIALILDAGYITDDDDDRSSFNLVIFIGFWYWGYANACKLFKDGRFPFSMIFVILLFLGVKSLMSLPPYDYSLLFLFLFYVAGFLCALLLILLDKCFHVLSPDRKLRTILLTMFCCYLVFSGDEWLKFYWHRLPCFAQVNPVLVVAPTLKGKTLSLERHKQKDGNLDIFTDTYRDDATGKLYLTQKIYARTDSTGAGWYGQFIYQTLLRTRFNHYKDRYPEPQFLFNEGMTCPRPLYDFSKQYDFRTDRPKGEM